jgi:hypothetical protein
MDPQATWEALLEAISAKDTERTRELAEALLDWMKRGGFPPRATTGSDLGQRWDLAIATAGCGFALCQVQRGDNDASQ